MTDSERDCNEMLGAWVKYVTESGPNDVPYKVVAVTKLYDGGPGVMLANQQESGRANRLRVLTRISETQAKLLWDKAYPARPFNPNFT